MKVYAVHDVRRNRIAVYVETGASACGRNRLYLMHGPDGHDRVVEVAPCTEAPHYLSMPLPLAAQVAAALVGEPLADEAVTLDTWRDFAALVDRVTAPVETGTSRP